MLIELIPKCEREQAVLVGSTLYRGAVAVMQFPGETGAYVASNVPTRAARVPPSCELCSMENRLAAAAAR